MPCKNCECEKFPEDCGCADCTPENCDCRDVNSQRPQQLQEAISIPGQPFVIATDVDLHKLNMGDPRANKA